MMWDGFHLVLGHALQSPAIVATPSSVETATCPEKRNGRGQLLGVLRSAGIEYRNGVRPVAIFRVSSEVFIMTPTETRLAILDTALTYSAALFSICFTRHQVQQLSAREAA